MADISKLPKRTPGLDGQNLSSTPLHFDAIQFRMQILYNHKTTLFASFAYAHFSFNNPWLLQFRIRLSSVCTQWYPFLGSTASQIPKKGAHLHKMCSAANWMIHDKKKMQLPLLRKSTRRNIIRLSWYTFNSLRPHWLIFCPFICSFSLSFNAQRWPHHIETASGLPKCQSNTNVVPFIK